MKKEVREVIPNHLYVTVNKRGNLTSVLLKCLFKLITFFKERTAVAG